MKYLSALLLCLGPAAAYAAGSVDVYYVDTKLKAEVSGGGLSGSGSVDGDGYGVRAELPVTQNIALVGEYQKTSYDDTDGDLKQLRFGAGWFNETGSGLIVQYVKFDLDGSKADGPGVYGRLAGELTKSVRAYGQLGYHFLDDDGEDLKGLEYGVGLLLGTPGGLGGFIDYRITNLDEDVNGIEGKTDFKDLRLGITIGF